MFTRKDNENKKYFLPLIIKEQLFEHIKKEHVGLKDLRGWRLIRPFTGLVKTVPRSKHEEPPIFMKDSSDQKSCGTSTPAHKKRVNRAFGAGTVAHKARFSCKESEAAIIGQQKDIVVETASRSKRYATSKATRKMFSVCCGPVWGACITDARGNWR